MTSRDFCYWLQGYFEVSENAKQYTPGTEREPIELNQNQIDSIRAHLNLVFKHEIDPSNNDGKTPTEIQEYIDIHRGKRDGDSLSIDPYDIKLNC